MLMYSLLLGEVQGPGIFLLQGDSDWEEPSLPGPKGGGSSGMFCSREDLSATSLPVPGLCPCTPPKKALSSQEKKDKTASVGSHLSQPPPLSPYQELALRPRKSWRRLGALQGSEWEKMMLSIPPRESGYDPHLPHTGVVKRKMDSDLEGICRS